MNASAFFNKRTGSLSFALIALFQVSDVNAQKSDSAFYEITYQFAHARDTNNPGKFYREEFLLCVGRNASEFLSLTDIQNNKKIQDRVEQANASGQSEVNLGTWKPSTSEKIFSWQKEKKLYKTVVFRGITYKTEYPLQEIKWKIDRTTKTVAGYKCQLATGTWKGRQYNAWFTTDLPLPAGPWKLHGLPGIILEATDVKKEVSFIATAVQKKSPTVSVISLPAKAVAVTESQLKRLMEAPASSSINNDIKVTATISGQKTGSVKAKGINNPLEKEK